jgi:enoyl-CoA hydratase/carnithine racemase
MSGAGAGIPETGRAASSWWTDAVTAPPNDPVLSQEVAPGIEVLRLNRPHKRNALDSPSLAALLRELERAAADPQLRVLVLSTTDPVAFCAGADVSEPLDSAGGVARMEAFTRLYAQLDAFPVPVVTVCVGNCVGAGAEIAAASDLRVGGDNLKLAWAGARLGVPVGPARLAPLVGVSRAKDLVLTGRVLGMDEAAALGFVHRTASAAQAEAAALELADEVAAQSPSGVRAIKQMFRELDDSARRVAHENELLLEFQRTGTGLPRS